MKFSKYLETNARVSWLSQYLRYKELKKLLHEVVETDEPVHQPHSLSLSVQDSTLARLQSATPQDRFFIELETQVETVNSFTLAQAQLLRERLRSVQGHLHQLSQQQSTLQGQGAPAGSQLQNPPPRTISGSQVGIPQPGLSLSSEGPASAGASFSAGHALNAGHPVSRLSKSSASSAYGSPHDASQQLAAACVGDRQLDGQSATGMAAKLHGMDTSNQNGGGPSVMEPLSHWQEVQIKLQGIGREYLALEKFVNVNYAALQKILKKHDKMVPGAPCWNFYRRHTASQPWVQGQHHDIQATLARMFTQLHSLKNMDVGGRQLRNTQDPASEPMQHNLVETSRKFWVRAEDIAELEYQVLQLMPVCGLCNYMPSPSASVPAGQALSTATGASSNSKAGSEQTPPARSSMEHAHQVVNIIYLDNASLELYHNLLYGRPYAAEVRLRWTGEGPAAPEWVQLQRKVYREGWRPSVSFKDSFPLPETRVAEFLSGRWTFADARKYLMQREQLQALQRRPAQQYQRPGGGAAAPLPPMPKTVPGRNSLGVSTKITPAPSIMQVSSDGSYASLAAEMEATQREYALFKTYTEVQRFIETKALQPMVRVRMRQTIFQDSHIHNHGAASAAAANEQGGSYVTRLQLDTHIRALLEYSYDGRARIGNGLWRQARNADAVDFPYACVKVNITGIPGALPAWLQTLIQGGKLVEVDDFSKVLFACAGLLPDMVRAVPVWIDDPLVQSCLAAQYFAHPSHQAVAGDDSKEHPLARILNRQQSHRHSLSKQNEEQSTAATDITAPLLTNKTVPTVVRTATDLVASEIKGWQVKLMARQHTKGRVYAPQAQFVDPNQFLRNERVFLKWLTMSITLSALACGLLGVAATPTHSHSRTRHQVHVSPITAFVLLGCAIIMCAYGLFTFLRRSVLFNELRPRRYDDVRGCTGLNLVLIAAFVCLALLNVYDLVDLLAHRKSGGGDGRDDDYSDSPPPPSTPSPGWPNSSQQQGGTGQGSMYTSFTAGRQGQSLGIACTECQRLWEGPGSSLCVQVPAAGMVLHAMEVVVCGLVRAVRGWHQ